jgi:hypothetical protein
MANLVMVMRDKALVGLQEPEAQTCNYQPPNDTLMQFLQAL